MSTSREIALLIPEVQDKCYLVQDKCKENGTPILVYCTLRSNDAQARLFREGRSLDKINDKAKELREEFERPDLADLLLNVGPQSGKYVKTKAGPGQSYHNYGMAWDAVPLRNGEAVWGDKEPADAKLWAEYGRIARECGMKWGGDWHWPDKPHCELPTMNWRKLILKR
jgi:peptidoglycan L-alanyl-D-glutamate endopeptidase CwlK